ncbi:PqqD family peptide modification chaperone [Gammaproteobacteria bacterium]|nr:PqqD family peptide modification chaperone [Gammaproteobacteria bacterium]
MPVLESNHFAGLFTPFEGKRVVFVTLEGNVGDHLNHLATELLFREFGIEYDAYSSREITAEIAKDYDELVISGGGNMGGPYYKSPYRARQRIIEFDVPITVFPQSFIQNEEDLSPYKRVYVREKASRELNSDLPLAPDLALGYLGPLPETAAVCETGLFLRADREQLFSGNAQSLGDPARLSSTVEELFDLACRFEHVITDRLHFGIAALLAGREVTLLPNSYFKNMSFYRTWLEDLCNWKDDPTGIRFDREAVEERLYKRLAGSPSRLVPWTAVPMQKQGYFVEPEGDSYRIVHVDGGGSGSLECNATALMVWELCNEERTVVEIVQLLVDAFPHNRVRMTRDVQSCLKGFLTYGSIDIATDAPRNGVGATGRQEGNSSMRVVVREPEARDGRIRCSAMMDDVELWFEVDEKHAPYVSRSADPFLLVSLMRAMSSGRRLRIDGAPVTSELLENLEEFQRAWSRWRQRLEPVDVEATAAPGESRAEKPAITTFSGGVDSCYTVYRHLVNPDRRWMPRLESALMIQGFDTALKHQDKFEHSYANGLELLDGTGIELMSMRTNIQKHLGHWLDGHGLLLGAALTLLSRRYGTGIIANTTPYEMLSPLGSNPVTDPMMGSETFRIINHGGEVPRFEKIRAIVDWPPVLDHLRVCWRKSRLNILNCGKCLTCVLASLSLRCLGVTPRSLPAEIEPGLVAKVLADSSTGRIDWYDMKCIVNEAEARGIADADWLRPVKDKIAAMRHL